MITTAQTGREAPPAHGSGHEALALYEDARRHAISLWRLKQQLWKAGQQKFYKTSREFRAIDRMCRSDPTCQIRALADTSACRFADKHGDALFRKNVVGAALRAATMWFYGTLPGPTQDDRERSRTKNFSVSELILLEAVHSAAKEFIASAGLLPFMDARQLGTEARKWHFCFDKARDLIVRCSPTCQGFLWLLHEQGMPQSVAREIAAFLEESD